MTKISIIIPVYNSKKYIDKCIQSLFEQSYKKWEAILIDDGSTDGSGELCDKFSRIDERIKVVHKKNEGVSEARNEGINKAIGERIMFLDSDDMLESDALNELMNVVKNYDYDVVCWSLKTNENPAQYCSMSSECTYAKENNIKLLEELRLRTFTGWSKDHVKDKAMHFVVTKLIKKDIIIKHNLYFDSRLKYHEDTLFSILVLQYAKSIAAINKYYYIRTIHEGSATVSFNSEIDAMNMLSIKLFSDYANKYYKNNNAYWSALDRYKLSWFVQELRLDYMNVRAPYSTQERISYIKNSLKSGAYTINGSIFRKDLKFKQRILAMLINGKYALLIYILFKKILKLKKEI